MGRIFSTYLVLAFRLGFAFKILPGTAFGQIKSPGFRRPKAPEGWRSPRRFAPFERHRQTRQRLGVRRPSAAFLPLVRSVAGFICRRTALICRSGAFIPRRTAFIPRRAAFIPCRTAFIPCRTAFIPCRTAFIPCRTAFIPCRTAYISRRGAFICRRAAIGCR
jgi:hypothetical protein